ncbi:hypothetical protein ACETU7_01070 [Rhodococcus sp. 3Y1]
MPTIAPGILVEFTAASTIESSWSVMVESMILSDVSVDLSVLQLITAPTTMALHRPTSRMRLAPVFMSRTRPSEGTHTSTLVRQTQSPGTSSTGTGDYGTLA